MVYSRKVLIEKGKFNKKELEVKTAMGELFASSPYLDKKKKDKAIDKLFK